uniref:Sugar phosphate transporter domain-containing protein n=1 Tax=Aegilops tauschii subsp. strangulata TaxID=200361 RepID=A0A452Y3K2_AEGTS
GGEKFQLGTVGALGLSVVSSVSIVICNKALMSSLGFTFATTLTSWHLLVTFCSLHVALWMKFFEHKAFDSRTVMGFGVLNGISIGLLNLSLGFNSVGFYQMTKLAIIPCTVILETLFFRKKFSRTIQISLSVLLLGVGVATVTDLQLNAVGSILSLLAIITTCIAQIKVEFASGSGMKNLH